MPPKSQLPLRLPLLRIRRRRRPDRGSQIGLRCERRLRLDGVERRRILGEHIVGTLHERNTRRRRTVRSFQTPPPPQKERFRPSIEPVPPFARQSPEVAEVLDAGASGG